MSDISVINEIQPMVDAVLKHSQHVDTVHTDELLKKWYEAKEFFINAFGGLIYTCPNKMSFELSDNIKQKKLDEFLKYEVGSFSNYELYRFIDMNRDGFFKNELLRPYELRNGEVLQAGMKMLKAFKFFESDDDVLKRYQTKASMLIQDNKIEGYFCLSVHPLDYLSSSENDENWRSCHALDGEYRSGNLSYMMDKSTIVCYLKADNEKVLPRFPTNVLWNSKKWRMLMFIADDHNALFAGRQYPFENFSIMELARKVLFEKLHYTANRWSPWFNDVVKGPISYTSNPNYSSPIMYDLYHRFVPINHGIKDMRDLVTDGQNTHHFNDLLNSSCYVPYYCWRENTQCKIHFTIGAEAPCIICGQHPVAYDDRMFCKDCASSLGLDGENIMTCECCGRDVNEDDIYWVEEQAICRDCYDNETTICECCGERVFNSHIYYDEKHDRYICGSCWDEGAAN